MSDHRRAVAAIRQASRKLREADRVRILEPVDAAGIVVPAGSCGTIVAIWESELAYEVAFASPRVVVTLRRAQVVPERSASP